MDQDGELIQIRTEVAELLGRIDTAQAELVARKIGRTSSTPGPPSSADQSGDLDRVPPLLAFVHIPKTAGGTVTAMFANAYTKAGLHKAGNYFRGPEKTLNKVVKRPGGWENWNRRGGRVSVGHVPYGVFRDHLPSETRYMTFLREPVDRVLSHYYRHMHRPEEPFISLLEGSVASDTGDARQRVSSLDEAMVELDLPELNNLATRFLCGDPSPVGRLPASALDEAKANLSEFAFVGIQERFAESVVVLQRLLDLDFVPSADRHVSSDRPAVDELSPEERGLILEHNNLDAELYEFGAELFEEAVASTGDEFAADVEKVRELSAAANESYERTLEAAREWLERELLVGAEISETALRSAAEERGIDELILKRASRLLDVKTRFDPDHDGGEWVWTRFPPDEVPDTPEPVDPTMDGTLDPSAERAFTDPRVREALAYLAGKPPEDLVARLGYLIGDLSLDRVRASLARILGELYSPEPVGEQRESGDD